MQEGMHDAPASGGAAAAEWIRRAGSRFTWRPEARTAAGLIGAMYLYSALASIPSLSNLASEVAGRCVGGSLCTVPDYARYAAGASLVHPVAALAIVAGAALLLTGRRQGREIMVAGLGLTALAYVATLWITHSSGQFGTGGFSLIWPFSLGALWALVLAAVVALLPAEAPSR